MLQRLGVPGDAAVTVVLKHFIRTILKSSDRIRRSTAGRDVAGSGGLGDAAPTAVLWCFIRTIRRRSEPSTG
ncbi:MAG: hypothetical protein AAF748_15585 [Pseudomonadota bacterium]